jgi:hypothetical protein
MLAICIMIVGSILYGFNEASDGQLFKSFSALIAAYKE